MSAFSISSIEESTGQGGRGAVGGDVRSSSSVSSSFLERFDEREVDSRSGSPFYGGERVINGMSLFLLKGGARIDWEKAESSSGWPRIKVYGWAFHDVGIFRSDYSTGEELQWWADRSHIARDVENARLICLGVSHRNEGVFHGKRANQEDFFFVYTYMFNQLFLRVSFIAFQAAVLRELNVAPSQLHPNDWAAIQAFANETMSTLNSNVVIEHEEGFNKAMRQADFLLKVDPLAFGFDINKDVFNGKMLLIDEADDEDAGVDEPDNVDDEAPEGVPKGTRHSPLGQVDNSSFWNSVHVDGLASIRLQRVEECVVVLLKPEIPNLGRWGSLNRIEIEQKQSPSLSCRHSSAPLRAPGRRAVVFHAQALQRSPKSSSSGAQAPQKGVPGR
ncbi:hypothetical protein LR48_Vigan03g164100 [Vigna angularis]|uniref:Uncharacterized protein n=1 Tax=Phaseolus angularis TaxID=3914 RepID=A0A0L9U737_PHAAN|nr:hypothetical protein LR48_Vigan03g164100 [Vigna angularis]